MLGEGKADLLGWGPRWIDALVVYYFEVRGICMRGPTRGMAGLDVRSRTLVMISGFCVLMYREVKVGKPRSSPLHHFHVVILDRQATNGPKTIGY